MKNLDQLRNRLIDYVMTSNNQQLLEAIESIFKSTAGDDKIMLNSTQIELIAMGEADIETGEFLSEEELESLDKNWM